MILPQPMPLVQHAHIFDDPGWIYELKYDGFRSFAMIENGKCRLVSSRGYKFYGYRQLRDALAWEVHGESAILDGELVALDYLGRNDFAALMKQRHAAKYVAFDLLWLNGEDVRHWPLVDRKAKLKQILPTHSYHVLFVDHTTGGGTKLFSLACELDLEGVIAKKADSPYDPTSPQPYWIKIKNPASNQKEGRGDWFKKKPA